MPRTISSRVKVGRRPPHQVALAEAEAGAVGDEVAHRDLARDPRVVHLEPGRCFVTGSSQASLPSSTRIESAAQVKAFVLDAMPKSVSASTGAGLARPAARRSPSRARRGRP